jgi:hypothetical protein
MSAYKLLLSLHGLLGLVALVTFWLAGLSKKGSPLHKGAGKVYLLAMVPLLAGALPLAIRILVYKSQTGGIFLLYLLVIVTTSVWTSWRAIRDKRDWARFTGPVYRVLSWLNLVSGLSVLLMGLFWAQGSQVIFVAFSLVGLLGGFGMLRFARQPPASPRWWMQEHLGAMIGNGVATHIAFLSIGLPRVLPMLAGPALHNFAWLAPLAMAVLARIWLGRKYLPTAPPKVRTQAQTA